MSFVNTVYQAKAITKNSLELFLKVLVPFAPHSANELWEKAGFEGFVEKSWWPKFEATLAGNSVEKLIVKHEEEVVGKIENTELKIVVQVNGKLRANLTVPADISDAELVELAKADENVKKYLIGEIKNTVVVPGKLINFVI